MALTNPTKLVNVGRLQRFREKMQTEDIAPLSTAIENINVTCRGFTFAYNSEDKSLDLTPLGNTQAVYSSTDNSLNLIF